MDILRVDDNADDLSLFGIAVERSGLNIRVHTALDGQQAIDYLQGKVIYADRSRQPVPQVVVLDLQMPRSSGFDFLAWRTISERFASLPVIVLTDSVDPDAIERAYAMGANKCVSKPMHLDDWSAVVRQIWELGATSWCSQPTL